MGNTYPGPHGRRRAVTLNAADARTLLKSALPHVLPTMSLDQINQVQKVLDAAVVNPAIQKEYDELMRKAVAAQHGVVVQRDPRIVREAEKLLEEVIPIEESDKHIRLNFGKLLSPDALTRRTDNPDELDYLASMFNALAANGVWLRFDYKLMRDQADPSMHVRDQRNFQAWLSLGYGGDVIRTATGELTREALLSNTDFGAGYYEKVHKGTVQTLLDRVIKKVQNQISEGETWHDMQENARDDAPPGVAAASDALGGATFPSLEIWDLPHDLVVLAMKQNVGGNVVDASRTIALAAIATEFAARMLDDYSSRTARGAERAVKILTVAKTAGRIAETVLIVHAVFVGLTRLAAGEAVAETVVTKTATSAAKNRSPAAYYPTNYSGPSAFQKTAVAKTGGAVKDGTVSAHYPTNYARREAYEKTLKQAGQTLNTGEIGTAMDRYDLAFQQQAKGWLDDFHAAMEAAFVRNGGVRQISIPDLDEIAKALEAKWGRLID